LLCVLVPAPVRWRKANDPRPRRPDRKRQGDSRLRLLNDEGGSFNTFPAGDTAVSRGGAQQTRQHPCGARILREARPVRTFAIRPVSGGVRWSASGLGALHSPPGPHSPIGRGSGLKIRPVSVRARLGALDVPAAQSPYLGYHSGRRRCLLEKAAALRRDTSPRQCFHPGSRGLRIVWAVLEPGRGCGAACRMCRGSWRWSHGLPGSGIGMANFLPGFLPGSSYPTRCRPVTP
jgi:hypothetical protein